MEKLTYRQAFDKITEAYIKDEIKPCDPSFCFCGTLNKNDDDYWHSYSKKSDGYYYTGEELNKMESALFMGICSIAPRDPKSWTTDWLYKSENFEDAIFTGMCAALEVLKQIHKERGENVEDFQFTKRQNLDLCHNKQK